MVDYVDEYDFEAGISDHPNFEETQPFENLSNSSEDVSTPFIGMEFETFEVSFELWKKYSLAMGFGHRINYTNIRQKDGVPTSRTFVCCRERKKEV